MYKYRSTCRHTLLVHYNGKVEEVRPNQLIESKTKLGLPFLRWENPPTPPKRGRPKKEESKPLVIKKEKVNVETRKPKD